MPTSEIIDTLETIQYRADAIQMSTECLNDDLSDLLSELREKAKPAKVNHVFVPGDVVSVLRDGLSVTCRSTLSGAHIVLGEDDTDNTLLVHRGDGEGHNGRDSKDGWWVQKEDVQFLAHLDVDLSPYFQAPGDDEKKEPAEEDHEFVPGDVVKFEGDDRLPAGDYIVIYNDHTESLNLLLHRGDAEGCSALMVLPDGCRARDGWWISAGRAKFITHLDISLSPFFEHGRVPASDTAPSELED